MKKAYGKFQSFITKKLSSLIIYTLLFKFNFMKINNKYLQNFNLSVVKWKIKTMIEIQFVFIMTRPVCRAVLFG